MLKDNNKRNNLFALMASFNLAPTIYENTRVTRTSSSCVDNIFTNSIYNKAFAFEGFISDHRAQKILFESSLEQTKSTKYVRIFSHENKQGFVYCLRSENWSEVYKIELRDVNRQWDTFMLIFKHYFDKNFPNKRVVNYDSKSKIVVVSDGELRECKRKLDLYATLWRGI